MGKPRAWYNEIDPYAAQWLRNLIAKGLIAPGDVDTRSIEDVHPDDLRGYDQCHFFAGIGGWSLAARLAGIPDDFPLWTGSCPCQPFSSAGEGAGFADERHLWPAFFHLIRERRPPGVVGEQVASSAVGPWLDLVQADMEGVEYAFGSVAFPAAGIGAPHIRDRTYWLGYANDARLEGLWSRLGAAAGHRQGAIRSAAAAGELGRVAHSNGERRNGQHAPVRGGQGRDAETSGRGEIGDYQSRMLGGLCGVSGTAIGMGHANGERQGPQRGVLQGSKPQSEGGGGSCRLADCARGGWREEREDFDGLIGGDRQEGFSAGPLDGGGDLRPGPTNGFWGAADWLLCRDGKWRPVEPGTFPLAHGVPGRVGRLRAYGNAIVPQQAAIFLDEAFGAILSGVRGPHRVMDDVDFLLG